MQVGLEDLGNPVVFLLGSSEGRHRVVRHGHGNSTW